MSGRAAVAFATALVALLCLGLWLGGHPEKLPPFLRDVFVGAHAGLNVEATETIEHNYFREVSGDQLSNASLQGMARGLRREFHDRFSDYFSPESLARFDEEIAGRFTGIGLQVTVVKKGLRAEHVFRGSPADRGGIKVGEVIVSVDGESIAGLSSEAATAKIKGPEKSEVTVGVLDPASGKVRQLHLTREEIALPVAVGKVQTVDGRKVGDVRFASFSEGSSAQLRKAVEKVRREGAEGIVLDMRENGGGLLGEAVQSASIFLPKGEVVVTTDSRTQGHAVYKTVGGNLPAMPLVVLIDRNTASAAEILTAALADDAGATVVGTRSYGKGVFQQEFDLSNGGALKLTIGEYFTPNGVNLAASHGIHPDVKASDRPGTARDEALDRALRVLVKLHAGE
ncbi:MAG: S41 family peptidase [Solirubrobacterales bacterium]